MNGNYLYYGLVALALVGIFVLGMARDWRTEESIGRLCGAARPGVPPARAAEGRQSAGDGTLPPLEHLHRRGDRGSLYESDRTHGSAGSSSRRVSSYPK